MDVKTYYGPGYWAAMHIDSFNARTHYKGAAGALDLYLQVVGKRLDREDQIKTAKLER